MPKKCGDESEFEGLPALVGPCCPSPPVPFSDAETEAEKGDYSFGIDSAETRKQRKQRKKREKAKRKKMRKKAKKVGRGSWGLGVGDQQTTDQKPFYAHTHTDRPLRPPRPRPS